MSIELKIKAKHLALEPNVIRHEELKLKKHIKHVEEGKDKLIERLNGLVNHRKWTVRNEARSTHLARAYIANKPYISVEKKCNDEAVLKAYILPRVYEMVRKYHDFRVTSEAIMEWSKR